MPAVRVPANTPEYIGRVLDAGALGIIAPDVRSAEEAREVVKAAKFPPHGERANTAPMPHLQYRSFPAAEAMAAVNDATMVIVQFESAEALERADEIVAVEGVDIVLVGLNDYLADCGLPGQYDHPKVREMYSPRHRGVPQARQALRRRRTCEPRRPDRRIRQARRALRLDRHRYRLSARGFGRQGAKQVKDIKL